MNAKEKKLLDALAALSDADRERLARLAALAQSTPEAMWPFVVRDGFEECEASVLACVEADEYFKTNVGIDNDVVMADARRLIASYAKRNSKAD